MPEMSNYAAKPGCMREHRESLRQNSSVTRRALFSLALQLFWDQLVAMGQVRALTNGLGEISELTILDNNFFWADFHDDYRL